jgi:mRNA-degrading endonuclease toxin of MazEF toxin-antitoxin module
VPAISRGEIWLTDLGTAARVRPCLVLSVRAEPQDRVLITLVPHTTSVRGTCFEVGVPKRFLKTGGIRRSRAGHRCAGAAPPQVGRGATRGTESD